MTMKTFEEYIKERKKNRVRFELSEHEIDGLSLKKIKDIFDLKLSCDVDYDDIFMYHEHGYYNEPDYIRVVCDIYESDENFHKRMTKNMKNIRKGNRNV